MPEVGITGGIGAGKSTICAELVCRGATLIDADAVVRELQATGMPVFEAMVQHWGSGIVASDGTLDRAKVGDIAFSSDDELAALNAIVHPIVGDEISVRRQNIQLNNPGEIVIIDVPLLVCRGSGLLKHTYADLDAVVVVDCEPEVAIQRVMKSRGLNQDAVVSRMAYQATRADRLAAADFVVSNNGSLDHLKSQAEMCWRWIKTLAATAATDCEYATATVI